MFWLKCILFKQHYIFLYITNFFYRSTVHMLSKMVWNIPSTLSFSKYYNLAYLFRFATRFRCQLNLAIIVFETWSDNYLLPKVLIKVGFSILSYFFFFLGACLSKTKTKLFSKAALVLITDILLKISNLNWSKYCLTLCYINFCGSKFCFENSIHDYDQLNQFQRNL